MPGLDGTGPRRKGPKTGRGLGNCNSGTDGRPRPIAPRRGFGGGFGRGRGNGGGFRRGNRFGQVGR